MTSTPYLQLVEHAGATPAGATSFSRPSDFVLDLACELRTVITRAFVAAQRRQLLLDLTNVVTSTRTAAEADSDGTRQLLADARAAYDAANHELEASIGAVATTIDDRIMSRLTVLVREAAPSVVSAWQHRLGGPIDPASPQQVPGEESVDANDC